MQCSVCPNVRVFFNNLPVDLSRNVTKCDDLISATTYRPEYLGFNFLPVLLALSTCTHNRQYLIVEGWSFDFRFLSLIHRLLSHFFEPRL